jgi:predicted permease
MRQLKSALRQLRSHPTFSAAAIGVLTVGIAAATALFAVVYATLLRPLPYARADEIYAVRTTMTDGRFTIGLVASAEMNALRKATDLVVASALIRRSDASLTLDAGVRQVAAYGASVGFFELFGTPMHAGRSFNDEDLQSWMGSRVVLSHRAWLALFGGDPSVVGRTIRLFDGPGSLVVGIAPPAFAVPRDADLWLAMPVDDSIGHAFDAFVRLAPGTTPDVVQPRLGPMWDDLAARYPDQAKNRVFVMRPLLDTIVGDLGPIVVIAFAATGLLLLLAIANVANLLLARGLSRTREMAVRTALGATRLDLIRQLLVLPLVLSAIATALALPLAHAALRLIVALGGPSLPRADGIVLNLPVFFFAVGVTMLATAAIGLAPLVVMRLGQPVAALNEQGRAAVQGRTTRRALAIMVVAEIALAIALVAGAGRLVVSMQQIAAIDPGFTANGRLAVDVLLPVRPYLADQPRLFAWLDQAEERLRALGATVGLASSLPFRREWDSTTFVDITGRPTDPANRPNGRLRIVSPGFFEVMNVAIARGRAFTAEDRLGREPVVLVNEAWAQKFLPDLDPLRERVSPGAFGGRRVDGVFVPRDAAIVGIVRDIPYTSLTTAAEPTVYVSSAQVARPRQTFVIATPDANPERLVPQIRAALTALDARAAIDVEPLTDIVSRSLAYPQLGLLLMLAFGFSALVLTASGVSGVVAFVAAERTGEMAVRMALGATPGRVMRLLVGETGALACAGLVLGVVLAWWSGAAMAGYVYEVAAAHPVVLGGSGALVVAIATAAAMGPARRAARTEPARVLRS